MTDKIVFIGAGAHLSVAAEVAFLNHMAIEGVVDSAVPPGERRSGVTVIGDDAVLQSLVGRAVFHIAITEPRIRQKLRETLQQLSARMVSLVHPRAIVSAQATVGDGCFVAAGAIVNTGAVLSEGVVVNTGAQIDHDCTIGTDCHIAPGAVLAGNVTCGNCTFVASGAVIAPNIRVGSGCIVAANATVLQDVRDGVSVFGSPATEKK